jgi:hypothetical protein
MRALFILFILFIYFPGKSEEISLAYEGETLISYQKPYIYIIEKGQYRTIKIPEMTASAPIPFKFTDTTFARKFTPASHNLFKVNNKIYLADNLGGMVYELRQNELVRIDQSFEHKMQINSASFTLDNRIFKFGGYGFWSARNFFTYFDLNSKEWEAYSPVQGDQIPPGLFDVNQYKNGDEITYFNGMSIDPFDNLKFEKNQTVWHFNLRSKTWENRGKTALFFGNNPQNFQYKNYYFAFTDERRIIRVNFSDNFYEIFSNEAVSSKISPKMQPFVENEQIYFFANNHASEGIDLVSISLPEFLGNSQSKEDFIKIDFWSTYSSYFNLILGLILLGLIAYIWRKYRPAKPTLITDKNGMLYVGNAAINFDETELKVLRFLLKNDDVPNSELLELIEQKGVHFSHNIRLKNDLLNKLNLKLKAILQVDVNFIIFKKSDTDSRLKVYRLNKHYFKVSEEFLND